MEAWAGRFEQCLTVSATVHKHLAPQSMEAMRFKVMCLPNEG